MKVFRALLLVLSVLVFVQGNPQPAADPRVDYPCPEAPHIVPCLCEYDAYTESIDLDCSNVHDDTELAQVFQAEFPFTLFRSLRIIKPTTESPVNITFLTSETFNHISFSMINISHTDLKNITADAFKDSYERLQKVVISDSELHFFPFDMFSECPFLKDVRVFRNKLTFMPNLNTQTLEYLQISYNSELEMLDDAFEKAPNLKTIIMNDINLNHVPSNMFFNQKSLEYLDLSFNNFQTLYTDAFKFDSNVLREINLAGNNIDTIQNGAISGKPTRIIFLCISSIIIVYLMGKIQY